MPEFFNEGPWKRAAPGAMLDNAIVRRDLFFLLNALMANKSIAELQRQRLSDCYDEFAIEEISLRLATTASFLRARDDHVLNEVAHINTDETREWAKRLRDQQCGTLQEDESNAESIALTLRETCNKVLHATEYRFDVVRGGNPDSYVDPILYLYGWKQGKRWRAVLDVLRYVEIGMDYTQFS